MTMSLIRQQYANNTHTYNKIHYLLFLLYVSPFVAPSSGRTFFACSKLLLHFGITSACNFCTVTDARTRTYTHKQHCNKTRGHREGCVPIGPYKTGTKQRTYIETNLQKKKIAAVTSTNKKSYQITLKRFTQGL